MKEPFVSQRWPVLLDDASTIASLIVDLSHLLDAVTMSGSRLSAFPPLLLTIEDQSHATGWCCLPSTGEIGVDEYPVWGYHLTNMDIQLSKNKRSCSLPSYPRSERSVSDERIAPNPFQPSALARFLFKQVSALWLLAVAKLVYK